MQFNYKQHIFYFRFEELIHIIASMNLKKRNLFYPIIQLFSKKNVSKKPGNIMSNTSIYNIRMKGIDGKEIHFEQYKGKKLLIVNTASECGYTPQYKQLQELHENSGNKLTILGFPANNFGAQEPGNNHEIANFCEKNYGVTFQLFEKTDVVGENKNALYRWLTDKSQNGWNEEEPKWNFGKYLIDEKGELIKVFSHAVSPLSDEILNSI